ncbi:MAG TPA: aminotransferase class III-fold pyridoxal phosphate-dependent enzyme [Gemmatimonadaceae bacterium]|nr:aminotransferase class III-fold pyridoxal phosphate-dependent enzyme [Gemmatimonadaceae bacterium]
MAATPAASGSSAPPADWRDRAAAAIPGGASTGSKRPEALYGPAGGAGPTHFVRASGCRLTTADGRDLVDCTMALGSVALGYADPEVVDAVARAVRDGNVAGLSHVREVELAERLIEIVPCAERVRFLKSGAEGVAAAVRVARAYTGKSSVVGAGYFGWLDWCSTALGVPGGVRRDFHPAAFDDVESLDAALAEAGEDLAAIVVEPVVERLPSQEWIAAARAACDARGAVLIFDEMKTGFRLRPGGFQEYAGASCDVAVFGKALANGFPLAAVVGRAEVMDVARSTWISSTLAGESAALAAATAVLDRHAREDVCAQLWRTGEAMCEAMRRAIATTGTSGVTIAGIPPMWLVRFEDARRPPRFVDQALDDGVLFKLGAYDFASLAHDAAALTAIEHAATRAFASLGAHKA